MRLGELGKVYADGEPIMAEGERGDCMYVVQSGKAEVVIRQGQTGTRMSGTRMSETRMATLGPGDVFGEMAIFTGEPRSATVRALDGARIMTIDQKGFLRRVHEDPSLAFRILKNMAERVGVLDREVIRLRDLLGEGAEAPPAE